MCVCLIDTSIFLNLLKVPGRSQDFELVMKESQEYITLNCTFILPMATIIETGNHIAQNGDGTQRRKAAQRFVEQVKCAFQGEAPWQPGEFPNTGEIISWLDEFPDFAGKNKSPEKMEGTSFGDLSIIKEYEKACKRFSMSEVFIWSLDDDLKGYHRQASGDKDVVNDNFPI